MRSRRKKEVVRIVSDSELLVVFVTLDVEHNTRNISELYNIN